MTSEAHHCRKLVASHLPPTLPAKECPLGVRDTALSP